MRRFFLVLAVAALMAMMLVVMAAPAMARGTGSGGVVKIVPLNDQLLVSGGKDPLLQDARSVVFKADPKYPTDPIHPTDPINPNVYPPDPI